MFKGSISLTSKPPTIYAMNMGYFPNKSELFVFDDALAIISADSMGDVIRVFGSFAGHGISLLGHMVKAVEKAHTKKPSLPETLTVEELAEKEPTLSVATIPTIESVRMKTAVRPITQIRGIDLTFTAASPGVLPRGFSNCHQHSKQHVTSDQSDAIHLLGGVLHEKLKDDRFDWAK